MNNQTSFPDPVTEIAQKYFGIEYLFPWQRLVVANILDAVEAAKAADAAAKATVTFAAGAASRGHGDTTVEDGATETTGATVSARTDGSPGDELHDEDGVLRGNQIVLLPTGAGKSLCFQVPALMLEGATLIVYPLLALMGDQARRMNQGGLDPAIFRGSQTHEEREDQFKRLEGKDGRPPARLVIANPEVLQGEEVISRIAKRGVDHIAIDEAHCISEWGDTFRPVYLELKKIAERLKPRAVTAFTATASPRTLTRIAEALFDGRAHIVRGDSDRPNILYNVYHCRAKEAALIREVARRQRPMIVFCATRGGTERTAHLLRETLEDTDIRFYHAGLQKEEKIALETWFLAHERAILCCTCAFGMGVDKKNIRTVIHRDAPPTVEAYVQEAGRGGRDGTIAEAVLLWSPADRKRLEKLPSPAKERASVLIAFAESGRCRREVLLEALGDPKANARTANEAGARVGSPDGEGSSGGAGAGSRGGAGAGSRGGARGGEQIACTGCDICDGKAVQYPRDERLVIDYIARNRRAFTGEEAADTLYMTGNRISRKLTGYREWRRADFPAIINDLVKEKKLIRIEKWPWKDKLTIPKNVSSRFTRHPRLEKNPFFRVLTLAPTRFHPRIRLPQR